MVVSVFSCFFCTTIFLFFIGLLIATKYFVFLFAQKRKKLFAD